MKEISASIPEPLTQSQIRMRLNVREAFVCMAETRGCEHVRPGYGGTFAARCSESIASVCIASPYVWVRCFCNSSIVEGRAPPPCTHCMLLRSSSSSPDGRTKPLHLSRLVNDEQQKVIVHQSTGVIPAVLIP